MKSTIISLALMAFAAAGAQAVTWDFSTLSDADRSALNADTENWKYESDNNRWLNQKTMSDAPLMANGVELQHTAGLRYSATAADQVRVDDKKKSVTINNKAASFTIPGLKAGDKVTVSAQSSSGSTPRRLEYTNLTPVSGFTLSTDRLDNVGTVVADGDVTFKPTGGFYIYSITVDGEGGGSGDNPNPPVPVSDHSVKMNPDEAQMALTVGNDVKYYDTAAIGGVNFDKATGTVSVTPLQGDWTDSYVANVSAISFAKAAPNDADGEIVNAGLDITTARGWLESLYVEWSRTADTDKFYDVYIKGGDHADWTKVDKELTRLYETYGRVDIPGLPAGRYDVRVVVTNGKGGESNSEAQALNIPVRAHDRTGFAFKDYPQGVGAYDMDGRLKKDAQVIYITAQNAKTVQCDIQVGVKNGSPLYETKTGFQDIVYGLQKGQETRPICIRLVGTIAAADMDRFDSKEEGLQIKGKAAYSPVNLTIEGIGIDAAIHGFGMLIRNCSGVELRNFGVLWFMDDAISVDTDNSHLWVHHLDLFYGKPGSASDQVKGDGTLDIKGDSQFTTFAYNRLWDSGKASLCGMKGETGPNYIDYHHNWFDHSDSRHPRIRTMTVHVWNNYYDGVAKYGVGAAMQSNAFMEANYFRHTKNPALASKQGTDIKSNPKGTFSGEDGGIIKSFGNVYTDGSGKPVDYRAAKVEFDVYEATTRDEKVPADVKAKQGGRGYDNFDTDPALMHVYTPAAAADVPSVVTGYYGAGRINKGDFTWQFPASEDTNSEVIVPLQNAVRDYKSKLVKTFVD